MTLPKLLGRTSLTLVALFCLARHAGLRAQPAAPWEQLAAQAESLFVAERYDSAVVLGRQALLTFQSATGKADSLEVPLLLKLAEYYREAAMYDSSEAILRRADTASLTRTERPCQKAERVLAWAELRAAQTRYPEAESLYDQAVNLYGQDPGSPPRQVARALAGLGNLYFHTDRSLKADSLLRRALDIQHAHLPLGDPDEAKVIARLAMISSELGRADETEAMLLQSVDMLEHYYGPDHPRVAQMLANLGLWYSAQDRTQEAIEVLKRSLAIREAALGPNNPKLAFAMVNLAACYENTGQNEAALPLLRRAYEIRMRAYGPVHHYVSYSLAHLAGVYGNLGMLDSAEVMLRHLVNAVPLVLPTGHVELINSKIQLAVILLREGKYEEAMAVASDALERSLDRFQRFAPTLSDYEALIASNVVHAPLDVMLSAAQNADSLADSLILEVADAIIAVKGEFADELFSRALISRLAQEHDLAPVIDTLLRGLGELQRVPVSTSSKRTETEARRLDSLDAINRRMERRIAEKAHQFATESQTAIVRSDGVARALKDNTVALEFVHYHDRKISSYEPTMRYAALVIRKGHSPVIRFLGEARRIDSLVACYQEHMTGFALSGRLPTRLAEEEYRSLSARLYDCVWRPLEPLLGASPIVMVSPDAALNQLSLGTLVSPDGNYLLKRHTFEYIDALRDLGSNSSGAGHGNGLLAMGDPDFDMRPRLDETEGTLAGAAGGAEVPPVASVRATCANLQSERAASLPGTGPEIEEVARRWRSHSTSPALVFSGARATEETLKALAPGMLVLHLATHGFAFTQRCLEGHSALDPVSQRVFVQENPLLLSGLLLAGANINPELSDSLGAEDGILSAYEIAGLNLEGVQLAVLSACESGLGVARAHEGLFGVRRAFHMAGVRTVVSALWPVPDQTTQILVASLYDDPAGSAAVQLRSAQLARIKALRKAGLSTHPYSWGAFIASGHP